MSLQSKAANVLTHNVPPSSVKTPNGPVSVTPYAGGYNVETNSVGLGRFHGHGAELVTAEGIAPEGAAAADFPGITAFDVESKGLLFWDNVSGSLLGKLTSEQIQAIQQGLEKTFPGRKVVFDPSWTKWKQYIQVLKSGG